jgi:hypothetical protein
MAYLPSFENAGGKGLECKVAIFADLLPGSDIVKADDGVGTSSDEHLAVGTDIGGSDAGEVCV